MNDKEKLELLQSMADNPLDSMKKLMAKEMLTHDNPLNFFALVQKFGMETLYYYEDFEQQEIEAFYTTYTKEIEEILKEYNMQNQSKNDRWWFALEKTTEKISKDLDLEQ
jgi:hypothetical protein